MLNIFKRRNFRFGILSTAITAAVIVFIALLNAAVTAIFNRYPLNIDLTENRIFEISEDTEKFLASLDEDIEIFVLNTEDRFTASSPAQYFVQANEVIRRYSQLSRRVRLSYVDLLRNPNFNSQYPERQLRMNDILIAAGGKSRVLSATDLFNIRSDYSSSYVTSSKAEQAMTSALLAITSKKTTYVSVLGGHGEEDVTGFVELLRLNAWEVINQNLITEEIADGVSVLILAAPARDLSLDETRKLDDFLEASTGRALFYLASPSQPLLPNLDSFLAEWGIEAQAGTVFETDGSRILMNSPFIAFCDYAEDVYSKNMAQQGLQAVIPQSRPLGALFEGRRYRSVKPLVRYSPSSGILPADAGTDWAPDARSLAGNVPVLMLSSSTRNNVSGDIVRNHVLVSGSLGAVDQFFLESPNIANSAYFLELLGTLAERDDRIYIQDKTLGSTQLGVTASVILVLGLVFVVIFPLAVLGAGIAVWLRRRHR
ncbi:MAG: GldG family protein [Treponema sp.]|jgi:hypothetical protein|nr:GldG family protein [Treponema sp.]